MHLVHTGGHLLGMGVRLPAPPPRRGMPPASEPAVQTVCGALLHTCERPRHSSWIPACQPHCAAPHAAASLADDEHYAAIAAAVNRDGTRTSASADELKLLAALNKASRGGLLCAECSHMYAYTRMPQRWRSLLVADLAPRPALPRPEQGTGRVAAGRFGGRDA